MTENRAPMSVLHIVSGELYGGLESATVTIARCREFCPDMQCEFALCLKREDRPV